MATADTAPPPGPGLQDAANAMAGLLDRESGTPAPDQQADPPEDQAPGEGDVVADAETQSDETPPKTEEVEGETEGEEAADTPDEGSEEPPKATPLYTVKVGGKEEQVTLEEALKGYSRTRDYTQKTDALATDRTVLEQERSEVRKERQQYATLLTALQKQLDTGQQQEPDWEALYRQDPFQWAKARDEWRDKQDKAAAANFELQRLKQIESQEQKAAEQRQIVEGRQKMLEMVPAWKDAKKWDADRQRIVEYGLRKGYSADEIAQTNDPRAVVILNEARQWAELQANKPKPTTQRTGPQVAKAGSAPVANNQNLRARQRLAQTGRLDDAAQVFMGLIE
jgi:hypothetical protein